MLPEQSLLMTQIIREKYEAGNLVSREIEGSGVNALEVTKLCIHLIIAVSIAVIAALSVLDRLNNSDVNDLSGISDGTCHSARIES